MLLLLIGWSFDTFWSNRWIAYTQHGHLYQFPFFYISILLLGINLYLLYKTIAVHNQLPDPFQAALFVFLSALLLGENNSYTGMIVINGWLLFTGIWYMRKGNAHNDFALLNFGLLIIAILAISRFFDDNIPFIWRALFFLLTGTGFFIANLQLMRKRKKLL